ncbi:HAD-IIIA family hydrolase [Aeromonas jandaei]
MLAVIIAGGKGTRLGPLAREIPKPMVKLCGKPILLHQIEMAKKNGIADFLILTGHLGHVIQDYFSDGSYFGVRIKYVQESHPMGTAGSLLNAKDMLPENFFVFYGDTIMDISLDKMQAYHEQEESYGTLLVHPNDHPQDSDLLEVDDSGNVLSFHAKPRPDNKIYPNIVNAGLYILNSKILQFIDGYKASDLGQDVFPAIVSEGGRVRAYRSPEYIKDMGTPERYAKVEGDLVSGKVSAKNLRNPQKAIFLDRDGVINFDHGLVKKPDELNLIPGSPEAIRMINEAGYLCIVVTNQPGIAKNFFSFQELYLIFQKLDTELGNQGAYIDKVYFCPHHPEGGWPDERNEYKTSCECRKPNPGLIHRAAQEYNIDLQRSILIGDRIVDVQAGEQAGVGLNIQIESNKENALLNAVIHYINSAAHHSASKSSTG